MDKHYDYSSFINPTSDKQMASVKNAWSVFRSKHDFSCHQEILYMLEKANGDFRFSAESLGIKSKRMQTLHYSLRLLADDSTLMFSCLDTSIQIPVCWCANCDGASGSNSSLCCASHNDTYQDWMDKGRREFKSVTDNLPTMTEREHFQSRRVEDPMRHLKNEAILPLYRIVDTVKALASLMWKDVTFDPLVSIDKRKRDKIIEKLSRSSFRFEDSLITFDVTKGTFMFKDLTQDEPRWKAICKKEGCFLLAESNTLSCFSHVDALENWKEKVKERLLEIGGIQTVSEFNDKVKAKIVDFINKLPNQRLQVVDDRLYVYVKKDGDLSAVLKNRSNRFLICDNCLNSFNKQAAYYTCFSCNYRRQNSVVLLYFPNGKVGNYLSFKIAHLNEKFGVKIRDHLRSALSRWVAETKDELLKEHGYGKAKFSVVAIHHCEKQGLEGEGEANAWRSAYIIYGKIEEFLLGRRAKFINSEFPIGDEEWNVVQMLCKERNIQLETSLRKLELSPPKGYTIVEAELDFDKSNFTKTVYRMIAELLVYIGQRTILANRGRGGSISSKCHRIDSLRIRSKEILDILKRQGYDIDSNDIPCDIVAILTDVKLSQFVPETMVMMSYTLNSQILKSTGHQLINASYSTTEWTQNWFKEVQYISQLLFGKTVDLRGTLIKDNSLLFRELPLYD